VAKEVAGEFLSLMTNQGYVAPIPQNGYYPINLPVPIPVTPPITFRFTWSRLGDTINQAVVAASAAKVALVFADDNGSADSDIVNSLAANQDALIQAVSSANPNTVVVLSTGDPVLMPWIKSVKGILEMWYPGQEGGTSTAKLLLGQATPGGRLPITWPASDDQTPFTGHPERINGNGTEVPFSEGSTLATVGMTSGILIRCSASVTACPTLTSNSRA
jgi:Glycosyl hydrolase family 3 C-terminal domain